MGTQLVRLDLRTGVNVAEFGGSGIILLDLGPRALLAMAPMPDDGLAIVTDGATALELQIRHLDRTGRTTATLTVPLEAALTEIYTDEVGHVCCGFRPRATPTCCASISPPAPAMSRSARRDAAP